MNVNFFEEELAALYNYEENVLMEDDYISLIKYISIMNDDGNYFILPEWKQLLTKLNLSPKYCETEITWEDVKEICELEVKRMNMTKGNMGKTYKLISTLFDGGIDKMVKEQLTTNNKPTETND